MGIAVPALEVCPECGTTSRRVHSRYPRLIADLPCGSKDRIALTGLAS
ncbi:transposase family protein [Corticibacterium sp. UT-5YL-CI-8]|nr:transposase family protein [Tianweitania sp. UT-5YL-CI-8]